MSYANPFRVGKITPESHVQIEIIDIHGKEYGFAYILKGACGPSSGLRLRAGKFVIEAWPDPWKPKTRDEMLHVLRNPYGHSEENVRAARLWAANTIEQLESCPSAKATPSGSGV